MPSNGAPGLDVGSNHVRDEQRVIVERVFRSDTTGDGGDGVIQKEEALRAPVELERGAFVMVAPGETSTEGGNLLLLLVKDDQAKLTVGAKELMGVRGLGYRDPARRWMVRGFGEEGHGHGICPITVLGKDEADRALDDCLAKVLATLVRRHERHRSRADGRGRSSPEGVAYWTPSAMGGGCRRVSQAWSVK
jgi:hypothetical protein